MRAPMPAEMHIRFLGRNEQELRIRLRLQRAEVGMQLLEPYIREIPGMPVAVEVHDHRRVHTHRLQHRLERRRPPEPVRHGLDGVRKMPVRAQCLVSLERSKAIRVRVTEHVRERRLRRASREQKEDAHALASRPETCSWRRRSHRRTGRACTPLPSFHYPCWP